MPINQHMYITQPKWGFYPLIIDYLISNTTELGAPRFEFDSHY